MLVFYSFSHWLWKSRNSSYTNHGPAEVLCMSARRRLPTVLSLSVLMQLLKLNSIWLCSSFLNSIWLLFFFLIWFVNCRSLETKSSLFTGDFNVKKFHFSKYRNVFIVCWSIGDWVESVLCHHSSACLHHFCSAFLLMRNAGPWSFGERWRIDQQCAECPLWWSPLAQKTASKRGGLI